MKSGQLLEASQEFRNWFGKKVVHVETFEMCSLNKCIRVCWVWILFFDSKTRESRLPAAMLCALSKSSVFCILYLITLSYLAS